MIDKREKKLLNKHKKHHTAKHMKQMKKDMKKGTTFKKNADPSPAPGLPINPVPANCL